MWIIKHIYKKPFPQYQKATPSPPVESLPENNNCTLSQYFHCVCFFLFCFCLFFWSESLGLPKTVTYFTVANFNNKKREQYIWLLDP